MRMTETLKKIKSLPWIDAAAAVAFILMAADLFSRFTPVFDALPSEFGGVSRAAAAAVGLAGILLDKGEDRCYIRRAVLPVIAGIGLTVLLLSGTSFILDAALVIMLIICADKNTILLSASAFSSCVSGAAFICAHKGFIRNYIFDNVSSFGFRLPLYFFVTVLTALICLTASLLRLRIKKEYLKYVFTFIFVAAVSALAVIIPLKRMNLSAAVETGVYEIYRLDSARGIEVRMKGFDDYDVALGSAEPTSFAVTADGDHYMITVDSYGVTKTLCVIEGSLYAGNYDQSSAAHLWDIAPVPGTPYFTVTNTETGLGLYSPDGKVLTLQSADSEDEAYYFRIGSENLEKYAARQDETAADNDIGSAQITFTETGVYTGSAVKLDDLSVVMGSDTLTEGEDYEISYWNDYLPGTAHAVVTGCGEYTGEQNVSFVIVYGDNMLDDPFYRNTADYVVTEYRMAYLRYPSPAEVRAGTIALIGDSRTPDSVVWELYWNDAFRVSNAQFIEAMYRLMLLRNGSRAELSGWIAALDSGADRGVIIDGFASSPDYQNIWHSFGTAYR